MNAYTLSHLALDAGVSVHVVRDYVLRGLLRPVERTAGGYCVFDGASLQRLCFVWAPSRPVLASANWSVWAGGLILKTVIRRQRDLPTLASSSNANDKR